MGQGEESLPQSRTGLPLVLSIFLRPPQSKTSLPLVLSILLIPPLARMGLLPPILCLLSLSLAAGTPYEPGQPGAEWSHRDLLTGKE